MGFQSEISTRPDSGIPGDEVNVGQAAYTAKGYVSDGTAQAGSFAFAVTTDGSGESVGLAGLTGTSGDSALGFVERNQTGALGYGVEDSLAYPLGYGLNIAVEGQFWFQVPALADGDVAASLSGGEYVVVDAESGSVSFSTTDTGTGWQVVLPAGTTSATNEDLVIIEKF